MTAEPVPPRQRILNHEREAREWADEFAMWYEEEVTLSPDDPPTEEETNPERRET